MLDKTYKDWLIELKRTIRSTQIKASLAVNATVIQFYWDLGQMITEKQTAYGTGFLEQLSKDHKVEFPSMEGLSRRNLSNMVNFYRFYSIVQQPVGQLKELGENAIWQQAVAKLENGKQPTDKISQQAVDLNWQQLVAQIPWGHNILIFSKSADVLEARFYIQKTIENGWSRAVLIH